MKILFADIRNNEVGGVFNSRKAAIKAGAKNDYIVPIDTALTEKQLTVIANYLSGKSVKRIQGKDKALNIITSAFKEQKEPEVKSICHTKKEPANLAIRFRDLLTKKKMDIQHRKLRIYLAEK